MVVRGRCIVIGESTGGVSLQLPPATAAPMDMDPARRADVLFRVRRSPDHQVSAWWFIGAFLGTSTLAVLALSFLPTNA